MFTFNFRSPVVKSTTRTYTKKVSNIVEKDLVGVIHIALTGFYFVNIRNKQYLISTNSFDTKGKTILFSKYLQKDNRIVRTIHLAKENISGLLGYIPFNVGNVVKGNIIKENDVEVFDITKILPELPEYDKERIGAIKFFKKNYDSIKLIFDKQLEKEDVTD